MMLKNIITIITYYVIFAYYLIAAFASYYMLRCIIKLFSGDNLSLVELEMFYAAFAVILLGISFQNTGNVLLSFLSLIGLN